MLPRLALLLVLLATTAPSPSLQDADALGGSADQDVAGETEAEVGQLSDEAHVVDVSDVVDDGSIQRRVREILAATQRYQGTRVRVRQGVVFLEGTCRSEERRRWAGDLAAKTEGVVAVFNDLAVERASPWDVTPALEASRELWRRTVQRLPLFAIGLVVLLLAWLLARLVARWTSGLVLARSRNRILAVALEKVALGSVLLVGVYLFLQITDLTRVAAGVIGGTGILGLVLGLAFRDIGENLLASLLISVQRPFRVGDTVEVEGYLGVVHRVTMRGTILMDFDGNHIQIANSTIYKAIIKNHTANPKLRASFAVGIGYDAEPANAQAVALEVLRAHEAVLDDPEPIVLIEQLGSATVDLRVFCWIDGSAFSKLKVESSLMRRVAAAFLEAGVSMPDPAREVVFPLGVPVQMREAEDRGPAAPAEPVRAETGLAADEDLASEVHELQEQAERSRAPEEGANLLQT